VHDPWQQKQIPRKVFSEGELSPHDHVLSSSGDYITLTQDSAGSTHLTEKVILIIGDCDVTGKRLQVILQESFTVLSTATAREGLTMLSGDIGLVLLDYMLPDRDGADTLREIKIRFPSIPIIIITAYGSEEICQEVFRAGAIDYMKKPLDRNEIMTKIELLLRMRDKSSGHRYPVFLRPHADGNEKTRTEVPSSIFHGIMKAKNYIDENYMANVHISEIIKEAGMNRTYFCYYFKLVTGYTFRDYLVNKRLTAAQELLKNKDMNISDVAERVGYSSKYFSEVFKKSFGIPPKKLKT
jgi:two-component system response regulator YesN